MIYLYLLIGLFSGLTVASWNSFKDSPWENFRLYSFPRSILFSIWIVLFIYWIASFGYLKVGNLGMLYLAVITFERLAGEVYKGFMRKRIHDEFKPAFKIYRFPYKNSLVLRIIGIMVFCFGLYLLILVNRTFDRLVLGEMRNELVVLIYGLAGGVICAVAGAWKDVPMEGFKLGKFLRSPLAGILGAAVLLRYSYVSGLYLFSIIGFERITVEFYKTFYKRGIRGVFEGQEPIYSRWFRKRWIFFGTYLIGVVAFFFFFKMDL